MRSPISIRPVSGVVNPAMQSSSVVLPDPEGPKRMVNPGGALKAASSENSPSLDGNVLRMLAVSDADRDSTGSGIEEFAYLVDPKSHAF